MLIHKAQSLEEALNSGNKSAISNDLFSSSARRNLAIYDCFWSKHTDALDLPLAMAPPKGDFDSLFAEVATFHPSLTPISAYTHICSNHLIEQLGIGKKKTMPPAGLDDRKLRLIISLITAEVMAAAFEGNSKSTTPSIGYSSCKQTIGYAFGRAFSLYSSFDFGDLARRWNLARRLTNQEANTQATAFLEFATMLWGNFNSNNPALRYLQGEIVESILLKEYIRLFDLKNEAIRMQEAYNSRMGVFNSIVEKVVKSDADDQLKSSCIAYYCNTILPGSMTHIASLRELASSYPSIIYWYAAFASLSKEFDIRSAHSGVCLKVARDLTAPFSVEDRPDCDISIDELEVLSRVSLKASILKPREHRSFTISLLPGVNVDMNIVVPEANTKMSEPVDTGRLDSYRIKSLLFEAIDLINKTDDKSSRAGRSYSKKYKGD